MISKLLKPLFSRARCSLVQCRRVQVYAAPRARLVPRSQYHVPLPPRLHLGYALKNYWELIPLFLITCTSLGILTLSIAWAIFHKVDVVYSTHNRDNISRTMDLRKPSIHKIVTINQRYEPWPEMQDVLDKMRMAEKRALVRLQSCSHA